MNINPPVPGTAGYSRQNVYASTTVDTPCLPFIATDTKRAATAIQPTARPFIRTDKVLTPL